MKRITVMVNATLAEYRYFFNRALSHYGTDYEKVNASVQMLSEPERKITLSLSDEEAELIEILKSIKGCTQQLLVNDVLAFARAEKSISTSTKEEDNA